MATTKSATKSKVKAAASARIFTQTAKTDIPSLDRWKQVGQAEADMVYDMALRNELSGGTPVVREFEKAWGDWIGAKHAISVINGTAALYAAYFGLGVGPGDEVICPSYTWICTLSGALMLGIRPVFCESDLQSMMAAPQDIRRRITPRTKAIVAVHLWGNICDMDAIMKISRETGIPVIEDCSHAHGATYKGRPVGGIGHVGCWSLQGSKPVSAGEGGMMTTNDTAVFERACLLGQVNRLGGVDLVTKQYERYQPFGIGMKLRAHPLGIGIAKVQLAKLPKLNARRAAFIEEVEAGMADIRCIKPVKVHKGVKRAGFYGFPCLYQPKAGAAATEVAAQTAAYVARLKDAGLPAMTNPYPLLHLLPMFAEGFDLFTRNRGPLCGDYKGYKSGDLPATEAMRDRLIFLPVLSDPVKGAAKKVVEILRSCQ